MIGNDEKNMVRTKDVEVEMMRIHVVEKIKCRSAVIMVNLNA